MVEKTNANPLATQSNSHHHPMSMPLCSINTNTSKAISSNSGSQACAACKYQRRKCAPDCTLAPYFPHDRQRQFLNAHKLFGVSNITKIIKNLHPHDKDAAMETIVYESDVRAKDPVGGCFRIIVILQQQIELRSAELEIALQQIAMCRAHQAAAQRHQQNVNSHEMLHDHHSLYDQEYVNAQKDQNQDFQYSWELQDSMWVQSKGSCTQGSPLEGGFVKFDSPQATQTREMKLNVEKTRFEGEEAALDQHPITERDRRSAATMFTLAS